MRYPLVVVDVLCGLLAFEVVGVFLVSLIIFIHGFFWGVVNWLCLREVYIPEGDVYVLGGFVWG